MTTLPPYRFMPNPASAYLPATSHWAHKLSNVARGEAFATAVGKYLQGLGLVLTREYPAKVGIGSKATKNHRFDFGSSEVLVECKCYTWREGGGNPSAKVSTLNEAMMYFHSTPGSFRKMLFLPKTPKNGVRSPETLVEYYVRQHGHFIPASVEVWEMDVQTNTARKL